MKLWIFEKPSVATAVAKHLKKPHSRKDGYIETGDGYVSWCVGHVLEQCPPDAYDDKFKAFPGSLNDLPIIPKNNEWKLQISESKKKQVSVLKKLLSQCTSVVNGGDEGREGQLLVDEVIHYFKCKKPVQRILLNAMDDKSVNKAINNLQDNNKFRSLYESALGRSRADWLMGMNATRLYTALSRKQNFPGVLSVGRVQTPVLNIVVQRDEEIENFIPKDYFMVYATFIDPAQKEIPFKTRWLPPGQTLEAADKQEKKDTSGEDSDEEVDSSSTQAASKPVWLDESNRIIDKNEALRIAQEVRNAQKGNVSKYINKQADEYAPLPFTLTGLQVLLNRMYGFSAQQVLDTCQSLYEAGHLTYPRTDCNYLPTSQFGESSEVFNAIQKSGTFVSKYVNQANGSIQTRAWDDVKLGEHHAIIPTTSAPDFSTLSDAAKKTYDIVAKHYLAQFFPHCKVDKASVEVSIANHRFAASGRVVKNQGWRILFSGEKEKESAPTLPALTQGLSVDCIKSEVEDKKTAPPPRFTQGSLLDIMENVHRLVSDPVEKKKLKAVEGIGRSATRAGIINTLLKRSYIIEKGKELHSTEFARAFVKSLPRQFVDPGLTARWEAALDAIAQNKYSLEEFESKMGGFISKSIATERNNDLPPLPQPASSGSSASSYKSGAKSGSGAASKTAKGKKCPKCGVGVMIAREVKKGPNAGKKFKGCSNYPNCTHSEW